MNPKQQRALWAKTLEQQKASFRINKLNSEVRGIFDQREPTLSEMKSAMAKIKISSELLKQYKK